MLQKIEIKYQADLPLHGVYVFDDAIKNPKPGVLIAHDWTGCTEFTIQKAEKLAALGYVGFALDMYGNGAFGKTKEEKSALMAPLTNNRDLLLKRITSAFDAIKGLKEVDPKRIGAMGFCFGGLCVLDLARGGVDMSGVVSFHGALSKPPTKKSEKIRAKVLVLHGHDDPLVPMSQVTDFQKEMIEAHVDWQVHIYGGAMHSFTNPEVNDPGFGTVYNKTADTRSWIAMKDFFAEIFSS